MAWEWLSDAWDIVTDVAEPIGEALNVYNAVSDYGTTPGSEQARMLAAQDAGFNEGGWNLGGLFGLGTDLWSAYNEGQRAEQLISPYQQQQAFYERMLPMLEGYYDPNTMRKKVRLEEERQKGFLTDLWNEEDAKRLAEAYRRGTGKSSIYDTAQERTLANRGKILAGIRPAVEQTYLQGPANLFSGITNVGGLMSKQPTMSTDYQNLLRATDPYSAVFTEWLKRV